MIHGGGRIDVQVKDGTAAASATAFVDNAETGLDHLQAMQAVHVLPILRPWLIDSLSADI